jgi:RNA polymerase sigma-70 factor, ECF subfamily
MKRRVRLTTGAGEKKGRNVFMGNLTQLLTDWKQGNQTALDQLMPLVYQELNQMARRYLRREAPGHELQTGALVNEAYLRLVEGAQVDWQDRTHFFAVSARIMRRILIDLANERLQQKRGGGARCVSLDEVLDLAANNDVALVALDEALRELAVQHARKAQVVELRYFGGLSVAETAETLAVSPETVMRDWQAAKIWLMQEMNGIAH